MENSKFILIQEFMLDYDLSTKELLTYAIIYGFSQDNKSAFYGGQEYIAKWIKSSVRQVQRVLDSLCSKGFLEKKSQFKDGNKFCYYRALTKKCDKMTDLNETSTTFCQEWATSCQTSTTFCQEMGDKMAENNKFKVKEKKEREKENPSQTFENPSFEKMSEEEKQWTLENYPNKEFAKQIFEIFKKGALPCANENEINFLMRDFKNGMQKIKSNYSYLTHNEILEACKNYAATVNNPYCYLTTKLNFERFIEMKNFQDFLPANFVFDNFVKFDKKKEVEEEKQQSQEESKSYELCPICQTKKMYWNQDYQMFACETCKKYYKFQYIDDERVKRGL